MKRCILFAGGPLSDCGNVTLDNTPDDYIIACDAGYLAARHYGIVPHLAVGDFDSYHGEIDPAVEVLTVPAKKDDTDTMLGLRVGLERGCDRFLIIGGFGGRIDHTVANFQALHWLCSKGVHGEIRADANRAWAIREESFVLPRLEGWHLSVFALGGACSGVTLEGVTYPLDNAALDPFNPMGVSNEFAAESARITVRQGTLLVVVSKENA